MIADVFDLQKVDDFLDALARFDLFRARSTLENGGGNRIGAQPRMHADQDVVDDGLVLEDREVLEGAGNAKARQRMRRELGEIPAVKKDLAGGWPEHCADQIEECRLAGAVRADQAANLAGFDLEAHIFDGGQAAEASNDIEKRAHDSHRLRRL
jgi:hypothetical protein